MKLHSFLTFKFVRYVEYAGVMAAEHSLNIVKSHIPKVSQRLVFHLLERIAGRCLSHPKVSLVLHFLPQKPILYFYSIGVRTV